MGILRNDKSQYEIYENQILGILVAIKREDTKLIKSYFKKYKRDSNPPNVLISGFSFVLDEEVDSLKIDFSQEKSFSINDLIKFK